MNYVKDLAYGCSLYNDDENCYIKSPDNKIHTIEKMAYFIFINQNGDILLDKPKHNTKYVKYKAEDLYKAAFLDREDFCRIFYGMSKRMRNWIEKQYKKIGLVERYYEIIDKNQEINKKFIYNAKLIKTYKTNPIIRVFAPVITSQDVQIYVLRNNNYAIQYHILDIHENVLGLLTIVLSKKPNWNTFMHYINVEEIEVGIREELIEETFICFACEEEKHFLDIKAKNIETQIAYWDDEYCGCEDNLENAFNDDFE